MDPPGATLRRTRFHLLVLFGAAFVLAGCSSVRRLQQPLAAVSAIRSPEFAQATGSMLGASFLPGNRITTLNDGDEIFPAMLSAIRRADYLPLSGDPFRGRAD
jgi:cardiolipin synthase